MARLLELLSTTDVFSDAGTTPAVNDATVQQWNDQSGSANHRTQGTAGNRPTFKTNILNSQPILRFDGAGGGSDTLAGSMSSVAQPCTVALVLKQNAAANQVPAGGGTQAFLYDWSASAGKLNAGADVSFSVVPTDWNIIVYRLDGASSAVFVNKTKTTGNPGTNALGTNFTVGAWGSSGFEYAGDIAAVVVEDTALNDAGCEALSDELNAIYAVYAAASGTGKPFRRRSTRFFTGR